LLVGQVPRQLAGPAILLVILPGVVPGTLLMLSTPLVLFERLTPTRAGVPLLLLAPWLLASSYAAYRDLRDQGR
jgi:hypothetical protein